MVGEKRILAATDARPGGPRLEEALPEDARPKEARPGDAHRWREESQPQPGGRDPAPGELALVQSFINSHFDLVVEHGRDLLGTPAGLEDWLAARGMIDAPHGLLSAEDLRRAVTVREALRGLAGPALQAGDRPRAGAPARTSGPAAGAYADLNGAARGAPVEVRFSERGPGFVAAPAAAPLDRALGVLLAIAARAMIDGSWERLKVCPGDRCGWAFYDHSRNQSGRWCSMAVCGGRAKARSHYRRTRLGGS
jgi:predicted RNA-binding Zn ribbon-like protein